MKKRRQTAGRQAPARPTTVSGAVVTGTWVACLFFAAVAVLLGVVGIAGVVAARNLGDSISRNQLDATNLNVELQRSLSSARASSQTLLFAPAAADRATLTAKLFNDAVPAVEASLADLRNNYANDPAAQQAPIAALTRQWNAVRELAGNAVTANRPDPDPATATRVAAAFDQLDGQLVALADGERTAAAAAAAGASSASSRSIWRIIGGTGVAVLGCVVCGWVGGRRIRTALEPAQDQVVFADTLQMAEHEDEAHAILRRHLERALGPGTVTVLNRNNSEDRLEAVTELPEDSVLARTLAHAKPNSCLAVRAGRRHIDDGSHRALLGCPVCGPCDSASVCYPLTVGGSVIGSVLTSGAGALEGTYRLRARDSVGQAAPVLANLRNLAIAEIRASTDALTALPNKRTVGDTLRRMLAQASRNLSPMCLLTLDLDHFKQVNDRFGHPVGDQALASVGAALRSVLRTGDFAGRNGGEEFSVMLPDTELAGGLVTAEKIRSTVEAIVLPGVDLVLTVSIGIAAYPEHALTTERLERLADSALYVAKRSGRNRVEVASPAAEAPVAALTDVVDQLATTTRSEPPRPKVSGA